MGIRAVAMHHARAPGGLAGSCGCRSSTPSGWSKCPPPVSPPAQSRVTDESSRNPPEFSSPGPGIPLSGPFGTRQVAISLNPASGDPRFLGSPDILRGLRDEALSWWGYGRWPCIMQERPVAWPDPVAAVLRHHQVGLNVHRPWTSRIKASSRMPLPNHRPPPPDNGS